MKAIDLLISMDENYIFPALVLLESIFQNNSSSKINIHLLHYRLDSLNLKKLENKCIQYSQKLYSYKISTEVYEALPNRNGALLDLPKQAYFRLLMGDILPVTVKRILYLDVDITVNGSLSDFYNLDMGDKAAAVCEDFGFMIRKDLKKQVYRNLKFNKNYKYFNSGVLLIDLEKFRELYSSKFILDFLKNTELKLLYGDQCCLNYLMQGKVTYVDFDKYNCRPFHYPDNKKSNKIMIQNAVILHYGRKPWKEKFDGLGGDIYEKYAKEIDNKFTINRGKNKFILRKIKNNFILKIIHVKYKLTNSLIYRSRS